VFFRPTTQHYSVDAKALCRFCPRVALIDDKTDCIQFEFLWVFLSFIHFSILQLWVLLPNWVVQIYWTTSEYIALDKPSAAVDWVDTVFESVKRLNKYPRSGRVIPEIQLDEFHEIILDNHRVIYRIEKNKYQFLPSVVAGKCYQLTRYWHNKVNSMDGKKRRR